MLFIALLLLNVYRQVDLKAIKVNIIGTSNLVQAIIKKKGYKGKLDLPISTDGCMNSKWFILEWSYCVI